MATKLDTFDETLGHFQNGGHWLFGMRGDNFQLFVAIKLEIWTFSEMSPNVKPQDIFIETLVSLQLLTWNC